MDGRSAFFGRSDRRRDPASAEAIDDEARLRRLGHIESLQRLRHSTRPSRSTYARLYGAAQEARAGR
jgi:hypothetical protein